MVAYHFAFDLNHLGWLRPAQDFYRDPQWTWQRTAIVGLFLFCAGLGQAIAWQQGQRWPCFWRRWAQVAACALGVSAASWFMFPRSWISFGVLHGMAVMLLLLRLAAGWMPRRSGWMWPAGALALVLPLWLAHPLFDTRPTNWLGLVTHKPVTEDWVPVFPWLGVMLWGYGLGRWLLANRPQILGGTVPPQFRPWVTLGQWSLSFYMLHQPVLIGLVLLATTMRA